MLFILNVVFCLKMQPKKKGKSGANLNTQLVKGYQSYRSRLVKWLTLENEKKTAVSQDWWLHVKVLV